MTPRSLSALQLAALQALNPSTPPEGWDPALPYTPELTLSSGTYWVAYGGAFQGGSKKAHTSMVVSALRKKGLLAWKNAWKDTVILTEAGLAALPR